MHLGIDTRKTHEASCVCPACLGLQCLDRPRYFSGQLLTEAELNDEQAYMRAKMKLHNRFLHGAGVVCGLEVTCNDCGEPLIIQQGYAIDPCGNDIIVCKQETFDVIKSIKACENERRRQSKGDCGPITTTRNRDCKDIERHYCLTIAYKEIEARLSPSLRQSGGMTGTITGKACGCGCGGSQSMGSASTSMVTTTSPMTQIATNGQNKMPIGCEPTRIYEQYQFGIVEVPPDYCGNLKTRLEQTLLAKVMSCFKTLKSFLKHRISTRDCSILGQLFFTGTTETQPQILYTSYCKLEQAIHDLYCQNPLKTKCYAHKLLTKVRCEEPQVNVQREPNAEECASYAGKVREPLNNLLALLLQYVLECVCQALLPPCSPAQCDDRLILACLTVKDDKIVEICDFCHRQYAGSFPTLNYWLSLVPVIPLIANAIERICCYDWLSFTSGIKHEQEEIRYGSDLKNGLTFILNHIDPGGDFRKAIFAGDYALPKNYVAILERLFNNMYPGKLTESLHPEAFNLATIMGEKITPAMEAVQKAGIIAFPQPVASADEIPTLNQLRTQPFARRGDHIRVYEVNDMVAGYAAYTPPPEIYELERKMTATEPNLLQKMSDEIDELKREIEKLKTGDKSTNGPPEPPAPPAQSSQPPRPPRSKPPKSS